MRHRSWLLPVTVRACGVAMLCSVMKDPCLRCRMNLNEFSVCARVHLLQMMPALSHPSDFPNVDDESVFETCVPGGLGGPHWKVCRALA